MSHRPAVQDEGCDRASVGEVVDCGGDTSTVFPVASVKPFKPTRTKELRCFSVGRSWQCCAPIVTSIEAADVGKWVSMFKDPCLLFKAWNCSRWGAKAPIEFCVLFLWEPNRRKSCCVCDMHDWTSPYASRKSLTRLAFDGEAAFATSHYKPFYTYGHRVGRKQSTFSQTKKILERIGRSVLPITSNNTHTRA